MGAGLNAVPAESGREIAQIIGSDEDFVPFDEMLVKKPGSWLPPIEPEVACWTSEREGDVCTFQRITLDPPLLTTCTVPSEKKDWPHQHPPTLTGVPPIPVADLPPRLVRSRRYNWPFLPAAAPMLAEAEGCLGTRSTPPDP